MTKLRACPFCTYENDENVVYEYIERMVSGKDRFCYGIVCFLCHARTDHFLTKEQAIEFWNLRDMDLTQRRKYRQNKDKSPIYDDEISMPLYHKESNNE